MMPRAVLYPPPPHIKLEIILRKLEKIIDYKFKDPYYGWYALHYSTLDYEFSNRRLAQLGDRMLYAEGGRLWLATGTSLGK